MKPCILSRLLTTKARLRGPGSGCAELYREIAPHATTRPNGRIAKSADSSCSPPTLSKYTSMPSASASFAGVSL